GARPAPEVRRGVQPQQAATGSGVRRHVRVGLPALARSVLPARAAGEALVRVLPHALRCGRGQQRLLPAGERSRLRRLAPAGTARLRLRAQGESLHHTPPEAQRSGRAVGNVSRTGTPTRSAPRPGALPTAAALAPRYRPTWTVP